MTNAVRVAALTTCLALGACAAIKPQATFEPSSQISPALTLYADGQPEAALATFNAMLADRELSIEDRRRALAGAALIHLQQGGAANLSKARQHVKDFTAVNGGPIAPEFFLLRESLDTAINAALSEHKKRAATQRENERLRNEIQRLEQTLTKLRELTLE